jgi:hypothetical protein
MHARQQLSGTADTHEVGEAVVGAGELIERRKADEASRPLALRDLWHIDKKFLVLLHADSTGSPFLFLDSCGDTTSPKRRLLLTNYELGAEVHGRGVQLGLNFADTVPGTVCRAGDGRRRSLPT